MMQHDITSELENIAAMAQNRGVMTHTALTDHGEDEQCSYCDACRIKALVLRRRPYYADGKYQGKPWSTKILRVSAVEQIYPQPKVWRVWTVGMSKSHSITTSIEIVVEHWSTIKQKWVYG